MTFNKFAKTSFRHVLKSLAKLKYHLPGFPNKSKRRVRIPKINTGQVAKRLTIQLINRMWHVTKLNL